ncbi:hypothetical protein SLEP1_g39447 [Rubroshorea leprosula]|uniref:Uncharacterized protein n=1 Tax=Rubroshorea leprosula TaxID=152421 RepID=A0AAV5L093_9ROSI|nr:hypothetical protein SLEP1_g39447 [Rubroshorea leprosula]
MTWKGHPPMWSVTCLTRGNQLLVKVAITINVGSSCGSLPPPKAKPPKDMASFFLLMATGVARHFREHGRERRMTHYGPKILADLEVAQSVACWRTVFSGLVCMQYPEQTRDLFCAPQESFIMVMRRSQVLWDKQFHENNRIEAIPSERVNNEGTCIVKHMTC